MFSQRLLLDQRRELADDECMPSPLEVRFHPLLERREAQLREPPRRRLCERLVPELDERGPAPEGQRTLQDLRAFRRIRRLAGGFGEPLEPAEVVVVGLDVQAVARPPGLDRLAPKGLAETRDVHLHDLGGACRWTIAPEALDEALDRDDTAGFEQQPRQQRAGLSGRKRDALAVRDRLERTEQAEVGHCRRGIIAR
jgi:hypothetical protein